MRAISKEVKEKQGTYEPSKEGEDAVEYTQYEINPMAPREFPPHIQKLWSDRCQDLKNAGYLMKAFMAPLKSYCFAVMAADEAQKALIVDGFIDSEGRVSRWVSVLETANKAIVLYGSKFGFTPLDLQKIPAIKKEDKSLTLLK